MTSATCGTQGSDGPCHAISGTGPGRCQTARTGADSLLGRPAEVAAELARAAAAQQADRLGPAHVVYFIETALATPDQERASRIARHLADRMASLGLVLPKPEQARVDKLLGNY
jgi:hypothetical protein